MEDDQIIELLWNRDETAVSELNGKYGAYCHTIAFNVLSNNEDAEECVSEALLRVWNAIPPERPKVLYAWLGRIVLNTSLKLWEKNHAKKRSAGLDLVLSELEDCVPSSQDIERQLESKEIVRVINSWLRTLNENDRAVFVRRYWYGDPVNELAAKCAVSPTRMAKRLYTLRTKLKKALEREGITL